MKRVMARFMNFAILSVLLPAVYGCGGGGGGLSSIFGGSSGDIASSASGDTIGSLATIHNPEPATLLLLGSGLTAMAFFSHKKRAK